MARNEAVIVRDRDLERDGWDDPVKGRIGWRTLFGGENSKTDSLTAGIAEVEPGGWLGLHRHAPAEIYYVLEGRGIVTIEGRDYPVDAGSALFIPGDAEHGLRNEGAAMLRFLYAFAVESFAEVEYRFSKA